ncbi:MAG: hypothetical protein EOO41_00990 [Methanobacteriota archaeon]|nr:MAG: hypothetical protein EOO41_00990 [Euryarchaeota archaeon]
MHAYSSFADASLPVLSRRAINGMQSGGGSGGHAAGGGGSASVAAEASIAFDPRLLVGTLQTT